MFSKGIQPFDFIKYNVIQKLAYKVQYISQINGDLLMFFRNVRIRFFKLDGSVVNNYGKNTRKRNTINIQLNLPNSNLKGERSELIWIWIRETVELRNKMRLCHFSIYIPGRFIHALKTCIQNQNIQKNKSNFERPFNGDNDQFTCQECRKVWITKRIFPEELENQFE